jgi:hypothetical protein
MFHGRWEPRLPILLDRRCATALKVICYKVTHALRDSQLDYKFAKDGAMAVHLT